MFETALPARKLRNRRRWIAFPAAVALHLTALVAFVSADYWQIRPVIAPDESAVFVMVTPPPPVAMAATLASDLPRPAPVTEPVQPPQGPVQPEDVKELAPPAPGPAAPANDSADDDDAAGGGSQHGQKGGLPNGSDDGILNGAEDGDPTVTFDTPAPAPSGPIHITARVQKPLVLQRVSPVYPEPARRARVQGAVMLEAVIDVRGNVTAVRVIRGLPMGLEQAAIQAVSQWRFQPATLDGRPVAVYFNLTVQFEVR